MKLSTFFVLLASALMLISAMLLEMMKNRGEAETDGAVASVGNSASEAKTMAAVSGRVIRHYGAEYSEAFDQWTYNSILTLETAKGTAVAATMDCKVAEVKEVDGGSCVLLKADDMIIQLQPVKGLRVFEGSLLHAGDVIGTTGAEMEVYAEEDGHASDPLRTLRIAP